MKHNGMNPKS